MKKSCYVVSCGSVSYRSVDCLYVDYCILIVSGCSALRFARHNMILYLEGGFVMLKLKRWRIMLSRGFDEPDQCCGIEEKESDSLIDTRHCKYQYQVAGRFSLGLGLGLDHSNKKKTKKNHCVKTRTGVKVTKSKLFLFPFPYPYHHHALNLILILVWI